MDIERIIDGQARTVTLTPKEREAIYFEERAARLREEAKAQLVSYLFGNDIDPNHIPADLSQRFEQKTGIPFDSLVTPENDNYLLDKLADSYEAELAISRTDLPDFETHIEYVIQNDPRLNTLNHDGFEHIPSIEDMKKMLSEHIFGPYGQEGIIPNTTSYHFFLKTGVPFEQLTDPNGTRYILDTLQEHYSEACKHAEPGPDLFAKIAIQVLDERFPQETNRIDVFRLRTMDSEVFISPEREAKIRRIMYANACTRKEAMASIAGLSDQDLARGFLVTTANNHGDFIPGAEHIAPLHLSHADFKKDISSEVAKCGIQTIRNIEGIPKGVYIDTPENRRLIQKALGSRYNVSEPASQKRRSLMDIVNEAAERQKAQARTTGKETPQQKRGRE